MLHANVSVAEALAVGISAIGLLVNAAMLALVVGDLRMLQRARRNGAKRLVAWTTVGVKGTLTAVQAIFVSIGLYTMSQPPPDFDPVVSAGRIVATTLLAALGVFMHARRMMLLDYLRDEMEEATSAGAMHAETMGALRHNTTLTEAAHGEATAAHGEATAAHGKAQTILGRIDEATRPKEGC